MAPSTGSCGQVAVGSLRSSHPERNLEAVLAAWHEASPLPNPFVGDEAQAIAARLVALTAELAALVTAEKQKK